MSLPTDPAANLATLIRCRSVTPDDDGALGALGEMLRPLGFSIERTTFSEAGTPDIDNLYARLSGNGPHLMFAGHTDVVPPGDEAAWSHPPFAAEIASGMMYGRGAVDMKGGIACFVAAVARRLEKTGTLPGSVSLLITGDEEGPSINGTAKLLDWAVSRGERWDAAIVGEPTNPERIGDMIKIGRRGSISGIVTVNGVQGHAAYPHLADNPVRGIVTLVEALLHPALDEGTADFQPTNLEVTSIDVGNPATNVIPARATAAFNIRFNDSWTVETIQAEIHNRLDRAAGRGKFRPGKETAIDYDLVWRDRPSPVFLTRDERLVETLGASIAAVTGRQPSLSTSGGTSDARFIKDHCPVVEFGLVGQTMHMVDERVALADLETLTAIYERFLADWFETSMPPGDAIQQYLAGAWRLMMGKPDGVRLLDLSADGFWSSFFAIVVAMPALAVGWVALANSLGGETFAARTGLMARLLVVDVLTWVVPLLLLGAIAGMAGIAQRYVAYVVASNWGSVIMVWIMLPPSLIELVWPAAGEALSAIALVLFLGTLVLSWRLTNAVLDMGPAVASAVFAGMFAMSLGVLLTLQSLLGVVPSA